MPTSRMAPPSTRRRRSCGLRTGCAPRWTTRNTSALILLAVAAFAVAFAAGSQRTPPNNGRAAGAQSSNIEIRIQEYSYAHGAKDPVTVAIEAEDISLSEVARRDQEKVTRHPAKPKPVAASIPTPTAKRDHTSPSTTLVPATVAMMTRATISAPNEGTRERARSIWWPYEMHEELSQQEIMMILVAIICALSFLALVVASMWSLIQFTWSSFCEQRLLRRLFNPSISAAQLEREISSIGASIPSVMLPLALAHMRLARLSEGIARFSESLDKIRFDEGELMLNGLPVGSDLEPMTFYQIVSTLESLQCRGESLAIELAAFRVPVRWNGHVNIGQWQKDLSEGICKLSLLRRQTQELYQMVVKTVESWHIDGKPIPKTKLMSLVAALRQKPAPSPNTQSPQRNRSPKDGKDEYGFLLRSFEELKEQQQVQAGLESAFSGLRLRVKEDGEFSIETSSAQQLLSLRSAATKIPGRSGSDSMVTRELERYIDRAEEMEMTHLEEVKRAQYMVEDARRESFCLLNSNQDAIKSVEVLTSNLVALGAEHKAAVLKAADIYAHHSNMVMLTNTLRSVFDEMRKGDMIKMEERRKRHAQKDREKRERIVEKFRFKHQLLVEKMDMQRQLEQELQAKERARREREERDIQIRDIKAERKAFIWTITKLDVLIVLVVMGLVFFENLTQLELFKPNCGKEKPSSSLLEIATMWWPPSALSLLQCRLSYALRLMALLVLGIFSFYVIAQLNLLTTALPVAISVGLYYVRAEWLNMVFRLPVLLVLYGFNSAVLYVLNRSDPLVQAKRRAVLLYGVFPIASTVLSVVVSITIACDNPRDCVVAGADITQRALAGLWSIVKEAYHL